MLAVPRDGTAAPRRQGYGIVFADVDKDAIGAQPRPLDRGDQTLTALIGTQVAHRATALVGTPLVDLTVKTAPDDVFVEGKPLDRGEPAAGKRGIVQQIDRFA